MREFSSGLEAYAEAKRLEAEVEAIKKENKARATKEWLALGVKKHTAYGAVFSSRKPPAKKVYPPYVTALEARLKEAKDAAEKSGEVEVVPGNGGTGFAVSLLD